MTRRALQKSELPDLDAASVRRLVSRASDIALLLDEAGTIREVIVSSEAAAAEPVAGWVGQPWRDVVTRESREKIADLLAEADAPARWRQVNHPSRQGSDWPVLYSLTRLTDTPAPKGAALIAFGRDLRPLEALQVKLLEAQQAMERDYWRFRQAEARYRQLFQASAEAVLVVDAGTLRVLEANPAASALAADGGRRLVGSAFPALFAPSAAKALQAGVADARAARKVGPLRAELATGGKVGIAMSAFRQDDASLLLVRLSMVRPEAAAAPDDAAAPLAQDFLGASPDAIVVTDGDGRIELCNPSCAELLHLAEPGLARGEKLDRWLGATGVELGVLLQQLRQHGGVRLFATQLRGDDGTTTDVELSAAVLPHGTGRRYAFTLRDVSRRLAAEPRAAGDLPRSAGELAELVGRVPLKDIVGQTNELIEQLCIETALRMTGDNRASAAQMLGLSRQSLYVKLRRYGLIGPDASDERSP